MRESAKISRETVKSQITRFHRGSMGRILERYLKLKSETERDFSLIELEQLWERAAQIDPAIGLHLFEHFTPQDWHVLAYITQFLEKAGDSFAVWEKYARLASEMDRIRRVEDGGLVGVEINIEAPDEVVRYIGEHYSVMSLTMLRRGTGQHIFPQRAQFKHARPFYYQEYTRYFGDSVEFNCPHNRLLYAPATAKLPMQGSNRGLAEVIFSELDRRIAQRRQLDGWAGKVAAQTRQTLISGVAPSLESLAESMHQSPRTLRRRLTDQGFSFRQVLDLVRSELDQSLELQGLNRAQIAERLGYSETTAYLHARKRWRESHTS